MSRKNTLTTANLAVPQEAIDLARVVGMREQSTRASVEAAAPLIVAAELERLQAEFGAFNRARLRTMGLDKESVDIPAQNTELARVRDLLSARAAELRGAAKL